MRTEKGPDLGENTPDDKKDDPQADEGITSKRFEKTKISQRQQRASATTTGTLESGLLP